MADEPITRLTAQAREDPQFFHDLVFNTEEVLNRLDFLDRGSKAALVEISPERVLATMVGARTACGGDVTCSCTSGTCDGTCGGSTCSVTCSGDSCGRTCDDSCGYTTNLVDVTTPGAFSPWDDLRGLNRPF